MRANTVAYIWRNSLSKYVDIPQYYGWDTEGRIYWMDNAFPPDIEDVLFDETYDEEGYDYVNDDGESSDEDIN